MRVARPACFRFALGAALVAGAFAFSGAGCSRSHGGAHAGPIAPEDEPAENEEEEESGLGFEEISVAVGLFDFEVTESETATRPRPITRSTSVYVSINGGRRETRVPGLRVFANDIEAGESGSAGVPEQWSYQQGGFAADEPITLQLRLNGSSLSFVLPPAQVVIERPMEGESVDANEDIVVRWSGYDQPPTMGTLGSTGDRLCPLFENGAVDETTAVWIRRPRPNVVETGCHAEITFEWRGKSEELSGKGLQSLQLIRNVRRIRRFRLEIGSGR